MAAAKVDIHTCVHFCDRIIICNSSPSNFHSLCTYHQPYVYSLDAQNLAGLVYTVYTVNSQIFGRASVLARPAPINADSDMRMHHDSALNAWLLRGSLSLAEPRLLRGPGGEGLAYTPLVLVAGIPANQSDCRIYLRHVCAAYAFFVVSDLCVCATDPSSQCSQGSTVLYGPNA